MEFLSARPFVLRAGRSGAARRALLARFETPIGSKRALESRPETAGKAWLLLGNIGNIFAYCGLVVEIPT